MWCVFYIKDGKKQHKSFQTYEDAEDYIKKNNLQGAGIVFVSDPV